MKEHMILRSVLFSCLFLSGCATDKTMLERVGDHYNSRDPCQYKGKPEGYKLADFCGASNNKKTYTVRDNSGKTVYKVE